MATLSSVARGVKSMSGSPMAYSVPLRLLRGRTRQVQGLHKYRFPAEAVLRVGLLLFAQSRSAAYSRSHASFESLVTGRVLVTR